MPKLSSHTSLSMPVHVVHGRRAGPTLFVSAAIHDDELNGVEIIRRVLETKALTNIKGTLVAVPVVNAYGLIHEGDAVSHIGCFKDDVSDVADEVESFQANHSEDSLTD